MNMFLNTLVVALNIMTMITTGICFGYLLVKCIKNQDTENFTARFFGMIGFGLACALLFTLLLGGIFDCGTEIILELLARR